MKPATTNGQYTGIFGGTSAAAPHVTGIAVYIRSIFPNLAPSEVKDIIEQTADKVYGMQGQNFHNEYGYGRVNAYRAVQMAQYMFDNDIDFIHSGNVSGTISENSLLAGEVTISSNLQVASGTELHIYKGASIKVSADKAILVYGDIIATGTSTDPILFSSTTPGGDQWWGVEINSGASITARYTTFDNMERGVWVDNASSDSPNNNGSVNTSYQADVVLGMGPGSLPKGSSFEDLFAFYQQARLFEEDSLYLDAVALYDSILINDNGDESTLLYAAMIGIERCYRSLDLEGAFIEKMDAFIAQYPDNLISTVANYMAGGALARIESLDESIARLETSIIEYGEYEGMEEQEAWALFDVGQVTEIIEESESGLGKASRVKNQLLNNYPASEAAEVLRDLLGKDYIVDPNLILPSEFRLDYPYPNPFNPSTTIQYELPKVSDIKIIVYDILGRIVWNYQEATKSAGYHSILWNGLNQDGKQAASGVYLISLEAPEFRAVQKVVLIR